MNIFDEQIAFLTDVELQIDKSMEAVIAQFDFVLKDYIVNKQLFRQGVDGDGEKLPGYKRTTIRYKLRKSQPVDRTTLLDEGDFHTSITITSHNDHFEVESNVEYDKFLVKRYGSEILHVEKTNMADFLKLYFLPNLKHYVHNKIAR